jgi:cytochrome c oxidase cbb3-type subunit 3
MAAYPKNSQSLGPVVAMIAACLICSACKREQRSFTVAPPAAVPIQTIAVSDLHPGSVLPAPPVPNDYEENAFALSEGKRLFTQMNCVGCHAHGGGGMGPPLMDEKWVYGSHPEQIFLTIVQGRPNGMPSFAAKIPNQQVWKLVAYVRSLSGLASSGASPGREDHMKGKPPESSVSKATPVNSGIPASAEKPY